MADVNNNAEGEINFEEAYRELESRAEEMGSQLGEYQQFFENITPLLEKLDESPELVQAIIDEKVDGQLAAAVLEGRVDIRDAAVVSQASQEVRKAVGAKKMEAMSEEDITRLVEDKANEIRRELEEKSDLQSFEERTQKFIDSTPDFIEYAPEIDEWLDTHDVADIEVAYYAVKGQLTEKAAKEAAEEARVEANHAAVANASGGGVYTRDHPESAKLIDELVAGPSNPLL